MTQFLQKLHFSPQLLFFLAGILVLYFFILLPKKKENSRREQFFERLAPGQKIVTIGGLHGTILVVEKKEVILAIDAKNSQLKVNKSAILVPEKITTS